MRAAEKTPSPNGLASWIYQTISEPARGSRWLRRCLRAVRSAWLKWHDPAVTFTTNGFGKLMVPFSHDLGLAVALYPGYCRNLGRLADAIGEKYPGFPSIDVGANVGDSARLLRRSACAVVLCVEGAPEFLPYLRANIREDGAVELDATFVATGENSRMKMTSARGSLQLEPDVSGDVGGEKLSLILDRHPAFKAGRLFKLDTDGLDLEIIIANLDWIAVAKPVLFFEYLPFFFRRHGSVPESFFQKLGAVGYRTAVVYDNFGGWISTFSISAENAVRDFITFFERDHDRFYADVALFSTGDGDIAEKLIEREFIWAKVGNGNTRPSLDQLAGHE